ncbi:unnamed protein product [Adineta steineri]|uniref:Uncharacterized protein n=1 Tax=Adineta steineri TaxID=433720 RepID=A0A814I1V4_9BILA|nr:unnamed protein product [Adineta steineri]CAF1008273.1 unnamed protein product [Adineta steineri]CAF1017594.1 unnamed protein product [Adineta steineri]CAF1368186.1 unnamed protein product [Adineta steineri]CAF1603116.1 unnamed protein product [Adineta steineri]
MVIFMPYYRQHGQIFHSHPRTRPSSTPPNGQHHHTTTHHTLHMSTCKFVSNILCRFIFSFFLFTIAFILFKFSINNIPNKKEGSNVIAAILLTVAIVSFLRTCQTLRRYFTIMRTRRRLIQRLRERQQAYDSVLAANSDLHSTFIMGDNTDLPSYKELFPSHPDISIVGNDPSSTLPPPSYDDFVKTLGVRQPITRLPIASLRPHALSLPTTSLSTSTTQSQTSPTQCIWITDHQARGTVCIRGNVTYV